VLSRDEVRAATLLLPALERVDREATRPQLLAIAPDRDTAIALATALNTGRSERQAAVQPITSVARGAARLGRGAAAIVTTAEDAVALIGQAVLKLDEVRVAIVVWGEEQLSASRAALESVLTEVPREADRMLLVSALNDDVETFATGFLWRARRFHHAPETPTTSIPLQYVAAPLASRGSVVRELLDAWNPASTALSVRTADGRRAAENILMGLGYAEGDDTVAVIDGLPAGGCNLLVFFDTPAVLPTPDQLGKVDRVVAMVDPRSLASFVAIAGDQATPLALSPALRDAQATQAALRDELRDAASGRSLAGEILTIEPLLSEFDALTIAGAALRLLDAERTKARKSRAMRAEGATSRTESAAPARSATPTTDPRFVRIFVNVGGRDGAGPGDLVGAITGEAAIEGSQLGKIELRDTFSLVEVSRDVAEMVVAKITGTSLKGRRVEARIDQGPRERPDRPPRREVGTRPGAPRDEGRPPRGKLGPAAGRREEGARGAGSRGGYAGGSAGAARGAPRGGRDDARGKERGDGGRTPRAMHERKVWTERGDALRSARRPRRDDA
jgi:ATP-dependent RNA helicase DeaD